MKTFILFCIISLFSVVIAPAQNLTTLVQFNGTNGSIPFTIIQGSNGDFYGLTFNSIFKMTPQGSLTVLTNLEFLPPGGIYSMSSLIQGNDGSFYGTRSYIDSGTNSVGASFWTMFYNMYYYPSDLSLCISSPVTATGRVTVSGVEVNGAALTIPFAVAAGTVTNIAIPLAAMETNYDQVETNGIYVAANQPVSVYGLDYSLAGSAAFTSYPVPLLGTNYCLMARAAAETNDLNSEFSIVATETNTTVHITPSATANLVNNHTNAYSITLTNQGQTYQINSTDGSGDVTGTWIGSDKPVAVFAGANIAFVPDSNTHSGNPLVQEQLPVEEWGTNIVAMSFAGRLNGDTYRVLAAYSNTVVSVTGNIITNVDESNGPPWTVTSVYETLTVTNQAGQFYDIIVDGPVWFQSTKPIQVAHFANGAWSDNVAYYDPTIDREIQPMGDPAEILQPPTGHYLQTNIVFTLDSTNQDFNENLLNLIVPQSATNATFVDGSLVSATNFVGIGASGCYGAQITITNSGVHSIISSQPVGVEVYGWGYYDAYGYLGGIVK